MLTEKDFYDLETRGISIATIERQLQEFRDGFPYADIQEPAVPGKGIRVLTEEEVQQSADFYDASIASREVLKFVPASGAATRMFKALFEFRDSGLDRVPDDGSKGLQSLSYFFNHLNEAAFSIELDKTLSKEGKGLEEALANGEYIRIVTALLEGMDYAGLPKGLLTFHAYGETTRLACEEHLVEGALYAADGKGQVRIHFTVSPEHRVHFVKAMNDAVPGYEERFGKEFLISYSEQKPSTDTLAADLDGNPFRNDDGSLLFRPGGHGALIENLNDLQGDILFIKNIDNVVPDHLSGQTVLWKKVIGGELLRIEGKVRNFVDKIHVGGLSDDDKAEIIEFLANECGLRLQLPSSFSPDEDFFLTLLNRPIRVCGMVRNEGEPGGGPFWVGNSDGSTSLQIVESAQIDTGDPGKLSILKASTHFNPVDLVCSVRDFEGIPFDLRKFIDPSTGFISRKSKDGRDLQALELPGLWNGAMAAWLTAFVEVPLITFNPVKTVNDLLREQHRRQ